MATTTRNKKRTAAPTSAGAEWACQNCGRPGAEVLAAHRLDAIRTALYGIGIGGQYHRPDLRSHVCRDKLRAHLRKIAKRLRAPYLPLLEVVSDDVEAGDIPGLVTPRCSADPSADCANEGANSAAMIASVRAEAGIDTLTVYLDEIEDGYESNVFTSSDKQEALAEHMGLPLLVLEVLVGGTIALEDIDAFNAWRTAEPVTARMLAEVTS